MKVQLTQLSYKIIIIDDDDDEEAEEDGRDDQSHCLALCRALSLICPQSLGHVVLLLLLLRRPVLDDQVLVELLRVQIRRAQILLGEKRLINIQSKKFGYRSLGAKVKSKACENIKPMKIWKNQWLVEFLE